MRSLARLMKKPKYPGSGKSSLHPEVSHDLELTGRHRRSEFFEKQAEYMPVRPAELIRGEITTGSIAWHKLEKRQEVVILSSIVKKAEQITNRTIRVRFYINHAGGVTMPLATGGLCPYMALTGGVLSMFGWKNPNQPRLEQRWNLCNPKSLDIAAKALAAKFRSL